MPAKLCIKRAFGFRILKTLYLAIKRRTSSTNLGITNFEFQILTFSFGESRFSLLHEQAVDEDKPLPFAFKVSEGNHMVFTIVENWIGNDLVPSLTPELQFAFFEKKQLGAFSPSISTFWVHGCLYEDCSCVGFGIYCYDNLMIKLAF